MAPLVALVILDGWGIAPPGPGNAVTGARTPFLASLFARHPHARLACSGEAVGLPAGQMGNSEVGHLNLGAGRVVYQDIARINRAIADRSFFQNPALAAAMDRVARGGGVLHLMGLVGDGGVHALQTHLEALIAMAEGRGLARVRIHAFLDGRDTPPDAGRGHLAALLAFLRDHPAARLASLAGRYYAMDRDRRWERVAKAYAALVHGVGPAVAAPLAYVAERYAAGEGDEFLTPAVVVDPAGAPLGPLADGDGVIFFNFRADRARALTYALTQEDFAGFDRGRAPRLAAFVGMTVYDEKLTVPAAFPPVPVTHPLAEVVSRAGYSQLHIAETEKYAHVTFFFNGGREAPFPGEDRVLVPSPKVATYDLLPAMSAVAVTDHLLARLAAGDCRLVVLNYANGDMVGHTGVYAAAVQAVETLDACLARLVPAVLGRGGAVLLTADHGNAEQMIDPLTGGPYTAHTVANPVPILLADPARPAARLRDGALCDVAPTVLRLMGLAPPPEMTGTCLLELPPC